MTDFATVPPALVWFRRDLRLDDNPALAHAIAAGTPVIGLFVLETEGPRAFGAAARWWLAQSLKSLAWDLDALGIPLILRRGPARDILPEIVGQIGANRVTWNRRYEQAAIAVDTAVKARLKGSGVEVQSFEGHLLREPWTVTNQSGLPFKVFTPFWRAHRAMVVERKPVPRPVRRVAPLRSVPAGCSLVDWQLEPSAPDWAAGFRAVWTPGEAGAHALLDAFLSTGIHGYADQRNRPDLASTSRLSPHLAFGEISPARIVAALSDRDDIAAQDRTKFLAELGWREFSYHLLHAFPSLAEKNFQERFDRFGWRSDAGLARAWQRGRTGYPLVDAGMRELWRTGWMHNRVRMVVASFLVKHLLIDWREGEAWFWNTLVDADPANNAASWQWVAGSGADAAPYFRIFNPVSQGTKFDPDGRYVRHHVPELAGLHSPAIHAPFQVSPVELMGARVVLGQTYPAPIVDHAEARERALTAFSALSGADAA